MVLTEAGTSCSVCSTFCAVTTTSGSTRLSSTGGVSCASAGVAASARIGSQRISAARGFFTGLGFDPGRQAVEPLLGEQLVVLRRAQRQVADALGDDVDHAPVAGAGLAHQVVEADRIV